MSNNKKAKMKCKQIHKNLYQYHERNLSVDLKDIIDEHLNNCPECYAIYTKFAQTINHLKDKDSIPEQPFYYTRLKQRMENKKAKQESVSDIVWAKKILQPAIYMASLVLAVYIGILIGSGTNYDKKIAENELVSDDYLEAFAEYQYLNDFQIESIENVLITEDEEENK